MPMSIGFTDMTRRPDWTRRPAARRPEVVRKSRQLKALSSPGSDLKGAANMSKGTDSNPSHLRVD